jgi:hypothetical protein
VTFLNPELINEQFKSGVYNEEEFTYKKYLLEDQIGTNLRVNLQYNLNRVQVNFQIVNCLERVSSSPRVFELREEDPKHCKKVEFEK